jgi:hypothetical protein
VWQDPAALRPLAPLALEYTVTAAGYLLVGVVGAVVCQAVGAGTVVTALLMGAVTFAVLAATGLRWLFGAASAAEAPEGAVQLEDRRRTVRRMAVEPLVVGAGLLILLLSATPIAAVIAGIALGSGVQNLIAVRWLRGQEARRGVDLLRETPPRLLSSGRRPVVARAR